MPFKFRFLLFFIFLSFSSLSQVPVLNFRNITDEQGLSNTSVESIFQDDRGFMWFGTLDGLNRYDGNKILVYTHKSGDLASLSDNSIQSIMEDRNHEIWIGTSKGLNILNPSTGKFIQFLHSPDPNSLSNNSIQVIFQDRENNIWIGTENGLNRWNPKTGGFTHFMHLNQDKKSLSDNRIHCLTEDSLGNLWIGTQNGLNLYDKKEHHFWHIRDYIPPKSNSEDFNNIQKIKADRENHLWILVYDHGLLNFDPAMKSVQYFHHEDNEPNSLGSDILRDILIDHLGRVWIGGVNAGLNLYIPKTHDFTNYHHESDNPFSLSQKSVQCLIEDRQNNIWIGTLRGGINLYSPLRERFKLFKQTVSPNSLIYDDIRSFLQDKSGRIWIGADGGGLDLFNEASGTFKHYRHDPHNPSSLSSSAIISLSPDVGDKIWISTWNGGLNLFNPENNRFVHYKNTPNNPHSINSDFVRKAFQDSQNQIWIATDRGGVNMFDPIHQTFSHRVYDPKGITRIWGNNIIDINEDHKHNIWILSLDSGINCYSLSTQRISHYYRPEEGATSDIALSFTDHRDRLWIGRKGLYLLDNKKNQFILYTHLAGLDREYIKGILEDNEHNLWISTSNGITKFNPETYRFKKFNIGDGLQGLEFEVNSCMKAQNGELFFGGVNGFNVFYPERIRSNPYIPPVYLTGFQILNKEIVPGEKDSPLEKDISFTREIHLNYKQASFSFLFSALNLVVPENNQYAYKLENFDKNWIQAGTERKAVYTNIDPGEYIFRVKASNNDGLWNEKGTEIKIYISPPFWQTAWFEVLSLILVFGLSYWILYLRRSFELKSLEEKKNEELHQIQLQFFTNISHEFRTPLSLILGPLEKISYETSAEKIAHYYQTIQRNAHRLMNLINELMDFRKVQSGALGLKIQKDNLILFLQDIVEEFKDSSENKKIVLNFNPSKELEESWFDRNILEKIVLNLINNAFKYTDQNGQITVELLDSLENFLPSFSNELLITHSLKAKKYFYILVRDNGIGISKESIGHLFERYYRISSTHLGSGVGLAFVKSLTRLHKGDIYVYSERNKGTEIIIALPWGLENYTDMEREIPPAGDLGIRLETPTHKIAAPLQSKDPKTELFPNYSGKFRILLVDDNEELREFLKGSLEPYYEIFEAGDGNSGLELLNRENIDLIISDIMMPGMNGIEFCERVKSQMDISHIPFVLLSAKDSLETKIAGAESGADIYLSKPISLNFLLLTLRNIFEKLIKQREKYVKDYYIEAKGLVNTHKDKEFLDKLTRIIESQIINPELDVDYLCSEIGMSKTKLYQKIKGITGQSIAEFVRTYRLKKAIQIMTHEDVLLNEVTHRLGFVDASYFSRVFKKEYGKTPSQFLQEIKKSAK
jgi:signal transduction histidine kinase/ligand-binding sensor domain-containing protein/AraC-like DNA-binding protein/ActR/RegA family two-component response regulator